MKSLLESLRTLLVLGRVSNLPTVWSNLIVGWALADIRPKLVQTPTGYAGPDSTLWPLGSLLLGGTLLYVGGMYLNDYCDVAFDTRYSPERPIPAGKISRRNVGALAALWFVLGLACFDSFGPMTILSVLFLIGAIVLYDLHHKNVSWAPIVMGLCRCLLYLIAAMANRESWYFCPPSGDWHHTAFSYICGDGWPLLLEVTEWTLPYAIPLGAYIVGITYLARGESRPGKPARWALILLAAPIIALYLRHWPVFVFSYAVISTMLLVVWLAWLLIPLWRKTKPSIGRVVSGLLAGIVLVDIIALTPLIGPYSLWLLILFALALLLQRVIPAT